MCEGKMLLVRRTKLTITDGANVHDILEKGLQDLMDMCDVVTEKFTIARDEFRADKMQA
jgi:DNA-directed RNA polymerase I and III subunit RPAC2